jgi:peptidoglycan hydrolase-like protein with peptidoglycan-binding domain
VTKLQQQLLRAGFDPGQVDGTFGPQTQSAVVAFQQEQGLAPDGVVGPLTSSALANAFSTEAPAALGSSDPFSAASATELDARVNSYVQRQLTDAATSAGISVEQYVKVRGGQPFLDAVTRDARSLLDHRNENAVENLAGFAVTTGPDIAHGALALSDEGVKKLFDSVLMSPTVIGGKGPLETLAQVRVLARAKELGARVDAWKPNAAGRYELNARLPQTLEAVATLSRFCKAYGLQPAQLQLPMEGSRGYPATLAHLEAKFTTPDPATVDAAKQALQAQATSGQRPDTLPWAENNPPPGSGAPVAPPAAYLAQDAWRATGIDALMHTLKVGDQTCFALVDETGRPQSVQVFDALGHRLATGSVDANRQFTWS